MKHKARCGLASLKNPRQLMKFIVMGTNHPLGLSSPTFSKKNPKLLVSTSDSKHTRLDSSQHQTTGAAMDFSAITAAITKSKTPRRAGLASARGFPGRGRVSPERTVPTAPGPLRFS